MMALVYHGTPITPAPALAAAGARAFCVSYFRPDSLAPVEAQSPFIMYDNGAFSSWMEAVRAGVDPMDAGRLDWSAYYDWLDERLYQPGRWAVIPDKPAAPSQINAQLVYDLRAAVISPADWPAQHSPIPLSPGAAA